MAGTQHAGSSDRTRDLSSPRGALLSVSKELGLRVHDVSLEIAGVHMFTQKTDLHEALNLANRAVLLGPQAEISFRRTVMRGGIPNPARIFFAQNPVQEAIADTARWRQGRPRRRNGRSRRPGRYAEVPRRQRDPAARLIRALTSALIREFLLPSNGRESRSLPAHRKSWRSRRLGVRRTGDRRGLEIGEALLGLGK